MIEIVGDSGVGKSELLLHLVIKCITPAKWRNYEIGGYGVGVIYIDNDLHFHILRLVALLDSKLRRILTSENVSPSEEDTHQFITSCLNLLKICHCRSSLQMILTLQSVHSLMNFKYNCFILIIDSLSAFYWQDRMMNLDNFNQLESYYRHLAEMLHKLSEDDKFIILFTRQQLIAPSVKGTNRNKMQDDVNGEIHFMGKDIKKLVNWKLYLSKRNATSGAIISVDIKHKNKMWQRSFAMGSNGIHFN